jgi:DNA-binding response OmpR family regulator
MPQLLSVDFIRNIRQMNTTTNIVRLSAFDATSGDLNSSKDQSNVQEIITKPFNFSQFLKVVKMSISS